MRRLVTTALIVAAIGAGGRPVEAQSIGSFRWQLSPFCNVVTVQVVLTGAVYTLDGYDDQCGAGQRASAVGTAQQNPDGSIGIGLAIVTAPGGAPVHVDATVSLATLGGMWRDSSGNAGPFVFTTGSGAGSPRPAPAAGLVDSARIVDGSVAAVDVNSAEVQRRVNGVCPADQLMAAVNADGSVLCQAVASNAGGDITGVGAGFGLSGGGATGNVVLAVQVGGDGNASTLARSDHEHAATGFRGLALGVGALGANTSTGASNVAVGWDALAANQAGYYNVAIGDSALAAGTSGRENTAVGHYALTRATTAVGVNSAFGFQALSLLEDGHSNTALGSNALLSNVSGTWNLAAGHLALRDATGTTNTALGGGALRLLTTGNGNIGVGYSAGSVLTNGSNNVYVANSGASTENNTVRIGGPLQSRAFVAGIRGVTTGLNDAQAVVIDSAGQLGTVSSSRRFKEDIESLGDVAGKLQQLRPVRFRYSTPFATGDKPVQYGLIAEEVADVLPELVVRDGEGQPASVAYHVLPSLLLAEVQRLERERVVLRDALRALAAEVATLRRGVSR